MARLHEAKRSPSIWGLRLACLLGLVSFIFLLIPDRPVQGRAGGGESYSGGSGGGGSSHSGGSGGSHSSGGSGGSGHSEPSSTFSTIRYPTGRSSSADIVSYAPKPTGYYYIGEMGNSGAKDWSDLFQSLFVGIFCLGLLGRILAKPRGGASLELTDSPPKNEGGPDSGRTIDSQDPDLQKKALAKLRERDPQFGERAFLERVVKGFAMIQGAWSNQDLKNVQAFLSDGVFERFSLQIEDMKRERIKDVMEDLEVLAARIVRIDSDSLFDTIHAFVQAEGVNYKANLDSGAFLGGSKDPEKFSEVWSFIRRLGSKTSGKPGLIEGFCPNCSAPVELSRAATCKACNSFLRSGEYDWVLSEITQTSEWEIQEAEEVPGLKEFCVSDPGFNVQHIEDRASVIFWRRMDVFRKGTVEPLQKYATREFLEESKEDLGPGSDGERKSFANPAVGSVETRIIKQGEPMDSVYVEIRWSGELVFLDSSGKMTDDSGEPNNSHDIYLLKRKHGVRTDTRLSLSSTTCPGCGAPETSAADNVCPFCSTAYNDGSKEWVLAGVLGADSTEFCEIFLTGGNKLDRG